MWDKKTIKMFRVTLIMACLVIVIIVVHCSSHDLIPQIPSISLPKATYLPQESKTVVPIKIETVSSGPKIIETRQVINETKIVPLGNYVLIAVWTQSAEPSYQYLLLSMHGEIFPLYEFNELAIKSSSDARFLTYEDINSGTTYIVDMKMGYVQPMELECTQWAFSKDNKTIGFLCRDGVRVWQLQGDTWVKKATVPRPKEVQDFPEDYVMMRFITAYQDGFAYFTDYSGLAPESSNDIQKLYTIDGACIDLQVNCSVSAPVVQLQETINASSMVVALSPDENKLAVAHFQKDEVSIFNLDDGSVIRKINTSMIDDGYKQVTSMIWGINGNDLIISKMDATKIFLLSGFNVKNARLLFDSAGEGFDSSRIIGWVTIE